MEKKYRIKARRWETGLIIKAWLLIGLWACGQSASKDQAGEGDLERGRQLYTQHACGQCHGQHGKGDGRLAAALKPPPRDLADSSAYTLGADLEAIAETVRRGVPGGQMPAFPFIDAADRRHLATFIRSLQH